MPKVSDLDALQERKRELLLESDINRQILRLEVTQLNLKVAQWRRNLLRVQNAYAWIAPLAVIVAMLVYERRWFM